MPDAVIVVDQVKKTFRVGDLDVPVIKGISLEIAFGDFAVIVGPSGCGKSTLLHILLGLETPNSGDVIFLGDSIYQKSSEDDRSDFRKKHIGMIYQQPNWIKSMNVVENVAFPLMMLGMDKPEAIKRALELLAEIQLSDWAYHIPTELSGGQQQRVALARALANNPEIIIADEPTGNLDYQAGQDVMQLLADLNKNQEKTIIMVTHDMEYLSYAKTAFQLFDGQLVNTFTGKGIAEMQHNLKYKRGASTDGNNSTK